MNQSNDIPTETELGSDVRPDEAALKPARKRRSPKSEADAPVEGGDVGPSVDGVAAKPARRRPTPVAAAVDASASDAPALKPARDPAPAPELAQAVEAPAQVNGSAQEVGPATQGALAGPLDAAMSDELGLPRSSRNRRRGRKDRPPIEPLDQLNAVRINEDGTPAAPVFQQVVDVFAHVVSGDFDVEAPASQVADTSAVPAEGIEQVSVQVDAAPRRVLQPEPDAPKLHKVLAQAGVGSRRDMEELILDGQITVNGEAAHIGQRISFGDQIKVRGKPIRVRIVPPPPRIIVYHKPVGEVVTHDDPEHRPTVFRRLPRLPQGKWQSVGRLDLNTEGLLLFTNSGELANQLMHPRFGVEREYAVRVLGTLSPESKAKLLTGVSVDGQMASFRSIEDGGGEGANHWYRVVITEGRNREVRKLFDAVGLLVSRLIRIRYGTVVLPRGLKRGVWVDLNESDVQMIRQLAGLRDTPSQGGQHDGRGQPNDRGGPNLRQKSDDRNGARHNGRGPGRNDRSPRDGSLRGQSNRAGSGGGHEGQFHARDSSPHDVEREDGLDFDPSKIPNPLEQTFDKRFVQRPRGPAGGAGFGRGGGGFGAGGSGPDRPQGGAKKGGGPREPDPLQTSMGYFGADAFYARKGGGGGGRGGNRGGGGGGGGGGGRRGGR